MAIVTLSNALLEEHPETMKISFTRKGYLAFALAMITIGLMVWGMITKAWFPKSIGTGILIGIGLGIFGGGMYYWAGAKSWGKSWLWDMLKEDGTICSLVGHDWEPHHAADGKVHHFVWCKRCHKLG